MTLESKKLEVCTNSAGSVAPPACSGCHLGGCQSVVGSDQDVLFVSFQLLEVLLLSFQLPEDLSQLQDVMAKECWKGDKGVWACEYCFERRAFEWTYDLKKWKEHVVVVITKTN